MTAPVDDPRNYTTLAILKEALDIQDGSRDATLMRTLVAAARSVDRHCGRRFWLDDEPSARIYPLARRVVRDQDGSERLLVDDIGSVAGLLVEVGFAGGDVWTPASDVEPAPDNALVEGEPVTSIRRYRMTWSALPGPARVRVTARWGWPAVPEVVAEATLLQASRLRKRRTSPEGVAGTAEWGPVRVTRVDPDVEALLRDLVLPGIG